MSINIPAYTAIRIIPRDTDFLNRRVGSRGEIFFDRDSNSLRIYDGNQTSGIALAKADLSNISTDDFLSKAESVGLGSASLTVSENPPENPLSGEIWFDADTAVLYVYYQDNDSGQWIQPASISFSGTGSGGITDINAGNGISVSVVNSVATVTNTGVVNITAGTGITLTSNQGVFTINSSAAAGDLIFSTNTVNLSTGSEIVFLPNVSFSSDVEIGSELVFADGSRQSTATIQGPEGPPGASGSGTGDVISVLGGYTDNSIVRYSGTSGTTIKNSSASINDSGVIFAVGFSGAGSSLTGLNATQLTSGTVPGARFPATLPAVSGVNLTALNATQLTSGTVPGARFPATLPAVSGVNLTALNATQLTSGTVPVNRLGTAGTRDVTTFLRGDNTWAIVSGGGTTSDSFTTISVSGQSNVVADSATDTLTLVAGTGIAITTNAGTDTITFTSTVVSGATAFTGLSDSAGATVDQIYLPAITALAVTNNGASAYRFDQYGTADNPTIYAINGTTIAFKLTVSGHPFLIQTSGGSNYNEGLVHVTTGGVVTTGSSAQGQTSGTLYWKIPESISGNYRYICSIHGGMVGVITIKNFASI